MSEVLALNRAVSLPMLGLEEPPRVVDPIAIEQEKAAMDKIQTASIVVGTLACNAACRFCVASMTPEQGIGRGRPEINWPRFSTFMEYAQSGSAETAMLTGKGEPTLFPDDITAYLEQIQANEARLEFNFNAKELQTNALHIADKPDKFGPLLSKWRELGLTTLAISIVHYESEQNRKEYTPRRSQYIDLPEAIRRVQDTGIRVRLAGTLLSGYIDSAPKLEKLISFARDNKVEELTVRPVNKPDESRSDAVSQFIADRYLRPEQHAAMVEYLQANGTVVISLPHGAVIYDIGGQNVCFTNCLTPVQDGRHRQLIFYPEGNITTDWQNARQLP
jgi:molybdenum cofactor biosynthesis enzyme MoaA